VIMSERLFFVHLMKTGGTTLRYSLIAHFQPGEVYPNRRQDPDNFVAYTDVSYLLGLPEDRVRVIRAYSGHFPYAAVQLMPGPFVTLTVLRDPVERTISYLKQCRDREEFRGLPLEQIYDDPWQHPLSVNYQARVFALTSDDHPLAVMNPVVIDDRRLAIAKANLAEIDMLGLHESYDEFTARVSERFGWPYEPLPQHRVGASGDASASLRRRIAEDNAADIEFYEYARELSQRRP
jgi:Sulfotransferase family